MTGWSWGLAASIFAGTVLGHASFDLIAAITRYRKRKREEKT